MGKKTPKSPETPDPVDSINAQAAANRVDTYTPYGSTRYISNRPYSTGGMSAGKNGGGLNGGYGLIGLQPPSGDQQNTWNGGAPINLGDGRFTAGDVRLSPVEGNQQFIPMSGMNPQSFADPYSASDYSQVTQLSPELQAVFNNAVGTSLTNRQTPFEQRLLPTERYNVALASPGTSGRDPSTYQRLEDALFQRQTRLLEPQLQQREGRLRQNLADRGLVEGSEAYNEALNMELDQANRARQDAAFASVQAGQDAMQNDRFMGLQEDSLNQQAFQSDRDLARTLNNDDFARRFDLDNADRNYFLQRQQLGVQADQAKFQQLASLLGLSPAQPITPIDVQGAINNATDAAFGEYNAKVNSVNQQNATTAASIAAIAQIAAAFSDRRLKTNIQQIGTTDQGYNLYRWDWKTGGSSVGVMADEMPSDRLYMHESGYLMVNYAGVTW